MTRYVLKPNGDDAGGAALDGIEEIPGVRLIDRIGGRAALVEATADAFDILNATHPDWTISPEAGVSRPSPPSPRRAWNLREAL